MKKNIIIALDGPAGSGKSTIAKIIAKKFKLLYLDTGAMYRAITYLSLLNNVSVHDENQVNILLKQINISFKKNESDEIEIYYNNAIINNFLRSESVDKNVSIISTYKEVRSFLVDKQRELSKNYDVILDGRDIGTVVFPNATYKFYIDASVEERARRRFTDKKNTSDLTLEQIKEVIINRDKIDSSREIGPLRKADDAFYIDTSNMSIEDVTNLLLNKIKKD